MPPSPTHAILLDMGNPRTLEYRAQAEDDGLAANRILKRRFRIADHVIRHAKWIENGIRLDGAPVHADAIAHAGQLLAITVGDGARSHDIVPGSPDLIDRLTIVFEDDDLLVIDKPAGIAMYPGPGHHDDTLANAVIGHYDATEQHCTNFHPAHRLDAGTSGLVVIAKHAAAQDRLGHAMHSREFLRTYLCLCLGVPEKPDGCIDAPIGRDPDKLSAWMVDEGGKSARTHYRLLATTSRRKASLLHVRLETGRTHQIRIHLAHRGHPLLGDALYGIPSALIGRPALHSAHLELAHPFAGKRLVFDAPPPDDFIDACTSLGLPSPTMHFPTLRG